MDVATKTVHDPPSGTIESGSGEMTDVSYPIEGACQCGAVTYVLKAPPATVAACHCRQCQKLSSSAFSLTAAVAADDIDIRGETREWRRVAASGNVSVAKLCASCGNHIYHLNPDEPGWIMLKPSTLADTRVIEPTLHVWVGEKQDWVVIPDGVTTYLTQP